MTDRAATTSTAGKPSEPHLAKRDALLLSCVQDAAIVTDVAGMVSYWNDGATKLFGWTADEMMGRSLLDRYLVQERGSIRQKIQSLLEGKDWKGEFLDWHKDGTRVWIDAQVTQLRDDNGHVSGLLGIWRDITARKNSEAAVESGERRYRDLVESSHDLIWTVDNEGLITFINQAAKAIYGWESHELIGKSFLEFITPETFEATLKTFMTIVETGAEQLDYQCGVFRKDGSVVTLSTNVRALRDPDGNLIGLSGISRDLSQLIHATNELQERQVLLSNAERIANMGSWDIDLSRGRFQGSQQTFEIFGIQSERCDGSIDCLMAQVHPEDRDRVMTSLSLADSDNQYVEQEFRIRAPGGVIRLVRERGEVVTDESGKAIRRLGMVQDITEQERNIVALRKSEERFQLAADGSSAGIWDWDIRSGELYYSLRFKQLLGYRDDEFPNVFSSFSDAVHPDDKAQFEFTLQEHFTSNKPYDTEFRLRTKSGQYRWFNARGDALRDDNGDPYRMAGSTIDITDQKEIEQDLRKIRAQQRRLIDQLEKEKSRLSEAQAVAKIGSWETDLGTMRVFWSDETYRIFEKQPESFSPNHEDFLKLVHPDDRKRVNEALIKSFDVDSTCKIEHRILLSDGSEKWVEESWRAFNDDDGNPVYAIGTCRDISETKRTQGQLADHTRRLEATASVAGAFLEKLALSDAIQTCAGAMVEHLDATLVRIWTLDPKTNVLHLQAQSGQREADQNSCKQVSVDDSPLGTIVRERSPRISRQPALAHGFDDHDWAQRHQIAATAAHPLLVEDRCIGVVETFLQSNLSQELETSLAILANTIAVNIDRNRAEENLRRLNEELESRVQRRTQELSESGRRLKTLLANLQGMAYRCRDDADWTMEFVSEGCRDLLGISPSRLTQSDCVFSSLVHPDDLPQVVAVFAAGLQARRPIEHEYRVRTPDGQLKWVWEQARGIYNEQGDVEAIEGFISDITDRKLRELRENHQSQLLRMLAADHSLKSCLEKIVSSIVAEDPALMCHLMLADKSKTHLSNRAALNLPSDYLEAIEASKIQEHGPPFCRAAFVKEQVFACDIPSDLQSGSWANLAQQTGIHSCWAMPILSVNDELLGTLSIYTDQSRKPSANERERLEWASELACLAIEHTRAKQALVDSESFNRVTLDALSAHIAVINSSGEIVATNHAWKRFATASQAEVRSVCEGQNYFEVCDAAILQGNDNAREVANELREIQAGKRESSSLEYACHSPDEQRWFQLCMRRIYVNGEVHILMAHENVTSIKQSEAALRKAIVHAEEASRAKSEFLATMSHELRTPLNGILGMNELLRTTALTSRQQQFVEAGQKSGQLLLALINDILDLSKIEAGKLELEPRECNLAKVAQDVVAANAPLVADKGLSLDCRLAPELHALVRCDDHRLCQILANLLGNAMKFTSHGGISLVGEQVSRRGKNARVRISITDTGLGIPEDRKNRLFKAFSQIDSSTTRQYGGTGLGLSICMQLVQLMGGEIGVKSQQGQGSTFWFEIPVEIIKETASLVAASPSPITASEQLSVSGALYGHVLVAEDNLTNQFYISELLKHFGCTCEVVTNGEEAIKAISKNHYDLILMDCQMPKMDGFTATREIRKREQAGMLAGKMQIVALTANSLLGDRERCLDAGMDDYISKPVQIGQLQALVQEHLAAPSN
ncbi:PAS domain-containing protein [Novipirellula sp. SH528]|uniref:PAS domain-containing protein n=1 Tax=Novipirellula sp. SH528 TaxID=3454466 RepID=UPI003FA10364